MAGESQLSITYDDLLLEVADFLGYSPDSADWTAAELAQIDRYVQSGLRQFYYPPAVQGVEQGYPWSFLHPVTTLATTANDVAQDLPDDLGRVEGHFHYSNEQHRRPVVEVSEGRYQELRSRQISAGAPQCFVVRHKAKDDAKGSRYEVAWWPTPDAAYTLTYQYEAYNGKLGDGNRYPLGGAKHSELLIESCLAVAELRANDERGIHAERFEALLANAVAQDRKQGAAFYGHMGDFSEGTTVVPRHGDTGGTYEVTYKGVTH